MNPFYLYEALGGTLGQLAQSGAASASYLRDLKSAPLRMPSLDTAQKIATASGGLVPVGVWTARRDWARREATTTQREAS